MLTISCICYHGNLRIDCTLNQQPKRSIFRIRMFNSPHPLALASENFYYSISIYIDFNYFSIK